MKAVATTTLLISVFLSLLSLTAVSLLGQLAEPTDDIRLEDLTVGRLSPMLIGPTLWESYPSIPPLGALVDSYSMLLVGGLAAAVVYVLRARLRKPLGLVSVAALGLGAIPYTQGILALHDGSVEPEACGPWLAAMLLGVLYASLLAAVLASMELTGWHTKLRGCTIQLDGES